MTRRSTILLAALVLFAASGTSQERELRLPGLDGGTLKESDVAQGAHIVVFWASWSPRGRDIVSRVNALVDRWGSQADVVTVNFQEDEADVRDFLTGQARMKAPTFLDTQGDFSKKHRVNSAPWLLVIKDGRSAFSAKLPRDADSVIAQALS